ncbi:YkgJ family cysteine cluster protein [Desulfogranum japonicum]|uniref:YkgJ family cysteine cluster protein n=1 Tax=Desulfogranum japonicum TaxID=231447 RepID=UPI00041D5BCA|nr:YkgJ family cysteine cluster protein [Desulfogranum japonicum]
MHKTMLSEGLGLLSTPVLPLISMVEFFLLTGDFTAAEVVEQLPDSIETGYASYGDPQKTLAPYSDYLSRLSGYLTGQELPALVTDIEGNALDHHTAASLLVRQDILAAELERVNSALCAPCNCTLCCTGPDEDMQQLFFEIPLKDREAALFPVESIDSPESRRFAALDEPCLQTGGQPFYQRGAPAVIHWKNGWSLVLPRNSSCPQLEPQTGRCLIYPERPWVCRRPQIFPYILEPVHEHDGSLPVFRQRSTLLAVMDCPYVQVLQEEIAGYAAACELEILFTHNKG